MGEENVHVINLVKWTTDIKKWGTPCERVSEKQMTEPDEITLRSEDIDLNV